MMTDHEPIGYELTDEAHDELWSGHPVDSTYYPCCNAVGRHARGNRVGRRRYVEINDYGHLVRLTPAGARELADYLLEAADAAEVPW
ncbi:hypothetical protein [Mycolicibacter icosiumassiliensis]|uniref:hypothetical protein n=1 Tax=Mycolicibacter icosiumassiliensis TaxID=1792835 RepID=UPI00082A5296|nr:hypothetical protein [Mycolicibacter icosiumassiliensis]